LRCYKNRMEHQQQPHQRSRVNNTRSDSQWTSEIKTIYSQHTQLSIHKRIDWYRTGQDT
jgi:hypothetical protein